MIPVLTSVSPPSAASPLATPVTARAAPDGPRQLPSAIVSLSGAQSAPASPVYVKPSPVVWQVRSNDAVTLRMARQYAAPTDTGRFNGLGAALVQNFAADGGDFVQSVSTGASSGAAGTAFRLSVATASGAHVTFAVMGGEGELMVQATASGSFDDRERAAVGRLADGFQKAIDGLLAKPPAIDVTALASFDRTVFGSIDMSASIGTETPTTLAMHADTTSRSLKVVAAGGTIDIGVDASNPAMLGTAAQRRNAMGNYLEQVDKATARGHGDRALATMYKAAFTQLHGADDVPVGNTRPMASVLSTSEHAMLSGLADFRASISQRPVASNPMRADETDGFSYDMAQETHIASPGMRDRELSQHRSTHLLASFHSPLYAGATLSLTDNPTSQNYIYTQIDDRSDSLAEIAYRNGVLVKATLSQSASQSTRTMKYIMGRLVEDTTVPASRSSTQDMLELLRDAEDDGKPPTRAREAQRERIHVAVNERMTLESDPVRL